MKLTATGYALAAPAPPPVPERRRVALPPAGEHPRRARLPGLAAALARSALGTDAAPPETAVLLATALGSLTETEAFVRQMIEGDEAAPKPRAFSASVHNAAAAQVAQTVGARGESRTLVHGPLGLLHALLLAERRAARDEPGPALVGGLDEVTDEVRAAWGACGPGGVGAAAAPLEGGALLRLEARPEARPDLGAPLASLAQLALGRSEHPVAWAVERLAAEGVDLLLTPGRGAADLVAPRAGPATRSYADWGGGLAGGPALACAVAVALLAGELPLDWLELVERPRRVGVLAATRWGEVGLAVWSR